MSRRVLEALRRDDVWRCSGCRKIMQGKPVLETNDGDVYCGLCADKVQLPCSMCGNPQKIQLCFGDNILPICSHECYKKFKKIAPTTKYFCKCGKEAPLICGKCKLERYCSRECQKEDWKKHKDICKKHWGG